MLAAIGLVTSCWRTRPPFATEAGHLSYLVGCTFGRWDIRFGTGERPRPELPDPFAPLPVCPPGMLQGDDGLPLSLDVGRRLRSEGLYPLDLAWDGVLVDDPEHLFDIERRVHAAISVLWTGQVDTVEREACEQLGMPSLREWFRREIFPPQSGGQFRALFREQRGRRFLNGQAPVWRVPHKIGRHRLAKHSVSFRQGCVTPFRQSC
jgi:hypothetical protein